MTTLATIRTKVRRLTGRPSVQSITDAQIDDYVNTFYLYDMPEHLKLDSLQSNLEFVLEANVDTYDLANFPIEVSPGVTENAVDVFSSLEPPVYVSGYEISYYQDQTLFFRTWNKLDQLLTTVVGDGTTGPYVFTLPNVPVYQRSVAIGAEDVAGALISVVDVPTTSGVGTWQLSNTTTAVAGSINYATGACSITFGTAIPVGGSITISSVPYVAARPVSMLYYDNMLKFRPAPDKEYTVSIEGYKLPTSLLTAGQSPALKQWWQYLAYGAAKKIFDDAQDPEGAGTLLREMNLQERLVLRRTIYQNASKRTATIYSAGGAEGAGNYSPNRF